MEPGKDDIKKIEFEYKTVDLDNFEKAVSQHLEIMIKKTSSILFEFFDIMSIEVTSLLEEYDKLLKSGLVDEKAVTPAKYIDNIFFETTGRQIENITSKTFLYDSSLKKTIPKEGDEEKEAIREMLSDGWKSSHHKDRIQYYLYTAWIFYRRLREDDFFILTDIPKILIMDRRTLDLTEITKQIMSQSKKRMSEAKRSANRGISKDEQIKITNKIIDSILLDIIKKEKKFDKITGLRKEIEFEMRKKVEKGEIEEKNMRDVKYIINRLNENGLSVKNFSEDLKKLTSEKLPKTATKPADQGS